MRLVIAMVWVIVGSGAEREVQHYYKKDDLTSILEVRGRVFSGIGVVPGKWVCPPRVQQLLDYMPLYDATRSCFGGFPRMVKELMKTHDEAALETNSDE